MRPGGTEPPGPPGPLPSADPEGRDEGAGHQVAGRPAGSGTGTGAEAGTAAGTRWETRVPSAEAMETLGERLGRVLAPGDWVALCGPLGAGKTTLVRGMARGLGARGRVASPTFTLVHAYRGRIPLFHLDLYRLDGEESLVDVADPDELGAAGAVAVEWADRAAGWIAPDALWLFLGGPGDGPGRRVVAEARGPRARRLLAALAGAAGAPGPASRAGLPGPGPDDPEG